LAEPQPEQPGVFLVCLIFLALNQWEDAQAQRYDTLLRSLGVDPETIRNASPAEAVKIMEKLQSHPDFEKCTEELLAQDYEWTKLATQQTDQLNDDAANLLKHPGFERLMPDEEATFPWLELLNQRLMEQLDSFELENDRARDTPENQSLMMSIFFDVAQEMAEQFFNQERLDALRDSLIEWEVEANDQGDSTLARQLRAAIFAMPLKADQVADSLFIKTLCGQAIRSHMGV